MFAEFIILFTFRGLVVEIFSKDPAVMAITNDIIWVVLIVIA
jgi:Na+-driven multidrug efflux pump